MNGVHATVVCSLESGGISGFDRTYLSDQGDQSDQIKIGLDVLSQFARFAKTETDTNNFESRNKSNNSPSAGFKAFIRILHDS